MNSTTLGIIATAVPLIVIGFFALRRLPWIFAFFVALVAVGIGYLTTTGAMKEVGHQVRAVLPAGLLPEHKKAEESAPADGGAMKALPPPTEPAAPTPPPAPAPEATPATPPATPPPAAESTPPSAAPAPEAAPATPPATPAPDSTPPAAPAPAPTPAPANP